MGDLEQPKRRVPNLGTDIPWTIGGQDPEDRLRGQVMRRAATLGIEVPTSLQTAVVLHALADHTALVQATSWNHDSYSRSADCVGRWLHDFGDLLEERAGWQARLGVSDG